MASGNVSIPIPNLISGVSQQPETLRLTTAAEAMTNAWPSVVTGLNKRPPVEHIANLGITDAPTGYIIDRDETYRYIVTASRTSLKVFDFNGIEQTVAFPNGNTYLTQATSPNEDFKFLTFGDTTFILNKKVYTTENSFGERGTASYTPNGTAPNYAALPAADPGSVYSVLDTGKYYRRVYQAPVQGNLQWNYQYTTSQPPGGYTSYDSLPQPTYEGQTCSVRREAYNYDNYYVARASSVPASTTWDEVQLADLVDQIAGRLNPAKRVTVYVVNSVGNVNYSIYIDGILFANFLTANGIDANNSVQSASVIAQRLTDAINANTGTSKVSAKCYGSTVAMDGILPTSVITVTSTNGDKVMRCYRDTIAQFSDLPPNEVKGRLVKVRGDVKNNQDDYYVYFDGALWIETYGYGQGTGLTPSSMPHTLRRNQDGTWTFAEHAWDERVTGDLNSNPGPTFLGKRLNDMIVYSGRMVFLSDSNIILSETGQFENYYRTTLQTLVDDDPIDLEVLSPNVDGLRHAVPFNRDLLLFSDRSQFRFSYTQYVGPKNVQVQFSTSFPCSAKVKPVNMGASVYFVDDQTTYNYAKVFEYFPKDNLAGDDAENVSDPIPQYITSGVGFIAASPRVKALLVGYGTTGPVAGADAEMFLFKYYWNGNTKVQNAWSRWTMTRSSNVLWAGFSLNNLFLITKKQQGGIRLEKIRVDEEIYDTDTGTRILLDQLVTQDKLTITYDDVGKKSRIVLPYGTGGTVSFVSSSATEQNIWHQDVVRIDASTYECFGDMRGRTLYAGVQYNFGFTFSTPYVRFQRANGTGELIAIDGRLQMRYMSLEYHDTSYFQTILNYEGRDPATQTFDAKVAGIAVFNYTPVSSGFFRIPLMGQNTKMSLTITNDSPFASSFGGAEWYGLYTPKAKRLG